MSEFLPGYEADDWKGIGAPKGTPVEIIAKLNEGTNAALADPKIKARLADLGGTPLLGSPADFGKFIAAETEKWGRVIRAANIKPSSRVSEDSINTVRRIWRWAHRRRPPQSSASYALCAARSEAARVKIALGRLSVRFETS